MCCSSSIPLSFIFVDTVISPFVAADAAESAPEWLGFVIRHVVFAGPVVLQK